MHRVAFTRNASNRVTVPRGYVVLNRKRERSDKQQRQQLKREEKTSEFKGK